MTIDQAIADLLAQINIVAPEAVPRIKRRSDVEANIRVYAPADYESAIKDATQERTLSFLTTDGLDIQVLVYDIATSLPPSD